MKEEELLAKKRKRVIEKAKKKTEAETRPLFVGYFLGDDSQPTIDEIIAEGMAEKLREESKRK